MMRFLIVLLCIASSSAVVGSLLLWCDLAKERFHHKVISKIEEQRITEEEQLFDSSEQAYQEFTSDENEP
ncbi:MAG: hypothetical protein ACFB10_01325 [Salibacteraceae bacterium]